MKKLLVPGLFVMLLLVGCAPGSSVEVTAPATSFQLSVPGPNPVMNQPDVVGRVANAGIGLWHGIIAPGTLCLSFFNSDVQMYEVHNDGSAYNFGFLVGLGLDFLLLGLLIRFRR